MVQNLGTPRQSKQFNAWRVHKRAPKQKHIRSTAIRYVLLNMASNKSVRKKDCRSCKRGTQVPRAPRPTRICKLAGVTRVRQDRPLSACFRASAEEATDGTAVAPAADTCTVGCRNFHPMAQCIVHVLKGMACRARVIPASSPASHYKQCSVLTSPALHARSCASLSRAR